MLPILLASVDAAQTAVAESGFIEKFGLEKFGLDLKGIGLQAISFLIVFAVLYRFGIKPTIKAMDERNKVIESGLKYAEDMKVKLEKAQQESEALLRKAALEAQAVVTDARKSAKELVERQTQDAAAQGAAILEKAQQSIELERKKMIAEVRAEIARLVTLTTAKVLSKELSAEEKTRFAGAASRELTNV
jgi:F-type H+-transporting ATPase subunit b